MEPVLTAASSGLDRRNSTDSPESSEPETAPGQTSGRQNRWPLVVSDLARDLRVRNTFLELPAEPGDDQPPARRITTAPAGQLGLDLDAMTAAPTSSAPSESSEPETAPSEASLSARDPRVRDAFLELRTELEDDHPPPHRSASASAHLYSMSFIRAGSASSESSEPETALSQNSGASVST